MYLRTPNRYQLPKRIVRTLSSGTPSLSKAGSAGNSSSKQFPSVKDIKNDDVRSIDIDEFLKKNSAKVGAKWRAIRHQNARTAINQLEKSTQRLITFNMDYSQIENTISVLQTIKSLVDTHDKSLLVKSMSVNNFRLILGKIFTYHQYYLRKAMKLQRIESLNRFANAMLLNTIRQKVPSNNKDLQIAKHLQTNSLNLARDFFRIFENNEDFAVQLTIADYELMARFEILNYKVDKAYKIFQNVEARFGQLDECLNDTTYWNLQFKVLANSIPQLWRYSSEQNDAVQVANTNWRGKLPFEVNAIGLLRKFFGLVDTEKITPNLETYIDIVLSAGYDKNLSLLRAQIKLIWGIEEGGIVNPEREIVTKNDPLYPNMNLMKAIISSFSLNGQFLEGIKYLNAFDELYNLQETNASGQPIDYDIWEVILKWADYNSTLPPPDQYKGLLEHAILAEAQDQLKKSEKENVARTIEKIDSAQVEAFKDKIAYQRNTLLDNVFNSYLIVKRKEEYSIKMFEMRVRQLREGKRLNQLIQELPIMYNTYMLNSNDEYAKKVYNIYLLTILDLSFHDEIIVNLKNIDEPSVSRSICETLKKGGPLFMFNGVKSSSMPNGFFDGNGVNFMAELNKLKKSHKYQKFQNHIEFTVSSTVGIPETENTFKNLEILKLLEFYRLEDNKAMKLIHDYYLALNQRYNENQDHYKNLVNEVYERRLEKFDKEDDNDVFFGVI